MIKFIKFGHRGAAGYEPENTLRSFQKAIELKADAVEFDVRLACSGEVVVIHDSSSERTTGAAGEVSDMSLAELKHLDAGGGEKIPTLEETLDLISRRVVVNIEIKDSRAVKPVVIIMEKYVSSRGWKYDDFMVSSFNHLDLWQIKQFMPEIRTGALIASVPPCFADFAKELQCYSVNVDSNSVTKSFVDELHKKEIKAFVYTANEPEEIARIKEMRVDGIYSDFPDRL
jgi:glycerophosphoryl diester phosphodiesterase